MKNIRYLISLLGLALFSMQLTAQCDFSLELNDSFGDGWNGGTLDVSVNSGPATAYTLTAGDSGTFPIPGVNAGDAIAITYTAGGFPAENEWALVDDYGNYLAVETSPATGTTTMVTATACQSLCAPGTVFDPTEIELTLTDSWGDGWNDATLNVSLNGTNTYEYTIFDVASNGSGASYTITLPEGAATDVAISFTSGGFDAEVTGSISDPLGNVYSFGPSPVGVIMPSTNLQPSICAITVPCTIDCPDDMAFTLGSGECGTTAAHGISLAGDCFVGATSFDVMDFNDIDGDMENLANWSSTSINFGSVWCTANSCGGGAGSVNYGLSPNSGSVLAWFGGAGAAEVGTISFAANVPAAQSAELCFAFENSVCGNANDYVNLTVDGVEVWRNDASTCEALGTVVEVCLDMITYADGNVHNFVFTGEQTTAVASNFTIDNVSFFADVHELIQTAGTPDGELVTASETVSYNLMEGGNLIDQCSFDITINANPNTLTSIACNNVINITLDDNCESLVGADLILEGGNYGCYDDYIVQIFDQSGASVGNLLTSAHAGQTLQVQVTDPNNNSCWGAIKVEDKLGAPLECLDVNTTCDANSTPGSPLASNIGVEIAPFGATIPTVAGSISVNLPVSGLNGATITDLNLNLDITHSWTSDLAIQLISPSGTVVNLVNQPSGAGGQCQDISVVLDDEATLPLDFNTACGGASPGISGTFTPLGTLSAFDGEDPNGDWTLFVQDFFNGDGGSVDLVKFDFTISGGTVALPIPAGATYSAGSSPNSFIVNGLDPCGPSVLTYADSPQIQDCTTPYTEIITRNWEATDQAGNKSSCEQTIFVYRHDLSSLVWPPNYDGLDQASLSCVDYLNEVPSPSVTGFPSGTFCSNIQIFPHTDVRIDVCPGTYEIIRKWKVLEWCSGDVLEHEQVIRVEDAELSIQCPGPQTISAGDFCTIDYTAEVPTINNQCSNSSYTIGTMESDINGNPTGPVVVATGLTVELALGRTYIVYLAEDDCLNTARCTTYIDVIDQVSPTPVCLEQMIVSIDGFGISTVNVASFDNGSNDNCSIDRWEARKIPDLIPNCVSTDAFYGQQVVFCCDEIGSTVLIDFLVWDESNNSNSCVVEVEVQDQLPPFITNCPADVTFNCFSDDYMDLDITGRPTFTDNCINSVVLEAPLDDVSLNNCGEGTITRIWKVIDGAGFAASCTQTITLVNNDPFNAGDITFPPDFTTSVCDTDLSVGALSAPYNGPGLAATACSLTAASSTDQVFEIVNGTCERVIRTWTVIDWCTYDPGTGVGIYYGTQELSITNNLAPVIDAARCVDKTVLTYEDGCHGVVFQQMAAIDDCTDSLNLSWTHSLDLFDDGNFEFTNVSGRLWSRDLPNGVHRVYWNVSDRCNNEADCNYTLTVKDGKKPTPYCLTTISTVVMNTNGEVALWASDFDFGSFDNCTPQDDLQISFSSDVNDTQVVLDCSDLTDGVTGNVQLEMWVTDLDGNQDFCSVGVFLQDNLGDACPNLGNSGARIAGNVSNEDTENLENVTVTIRSEQPNYPKSIITDATGDYDFLNLKEGGNYGVDFEKDFDYMNGVSTLDLVLIQKHILQTRPLDTPYKIIAADINDSGTITALDLVQLRKLILGINVSFPGDQKSWRFVDKSMSFSNPQVPFPFVEEVTALGLVDALLNQDFIGVKIGDVNGNASPSTFVPAVTNRSGETLNLIVDEQDQMQRGPIEIPVYAANYNSLHGYQFTMEFDTKNLKFVDLIPGVATMTEDNFSLADANKGLISTSFHTQKLSSVDADAPLFTLVMDVQQTGKLSNLLSITSSITKAEAYNAELQEMDLAINFRNGVDLVNTGIVLHQNIPNPFNHETTVSFDLGSPSHTVFTVYDVNGRNLKTIESYYGAGQHSIVLTKDDIDVSGLLYYKLETESDHAIRKMIRIR